MAEGNILAANGFGSRGLPRLAAEAQYVDVATISCTPSPKFEGDRGCDDNILPDEGRDDTLGASGFACALKKYSRDADGALNARGLPVVLSPNSMSSSCSARKNRDSVRIAGGGETRVVVFFVLC